MRVRPEIIGSHPHADPPRTCRGTERIRRPELCRKKNGNKKNGNKKNGNKKNGNKKKGGVW
ncbi:hypothetical protein [Dietzia sp. 111N12-1]|uniref:hypothetical protein n=1 Tax=Dietzia sp. 111N12-1 TaxID=1785156 RepID=UPI0008053D26|nr:hypothetical protein [Dietzia sp. 111N12-1]OAV76691.1 hypothetical protein AYO52_06860 [Dietzia sp. 111N12-1]